MTRARILLLVLAVLPAAAGRAQYYVPTPAPIVTAENETWYRFGEPITYYGNFYYPAGPRIFFDGNVMVRVGSYRGVPLYADTTIEPYSIVLVPLPGRLMQPYERRREFELAGTTGSRPPSFPTDRLPREAEGVPGTVGLRFVPQAIGPSVGEIVPAPPEERPAPTIGVLEVAPAPAPTPPRPAGPPPTRAIEVTKDRAAGSSGANPAREQLWIEFRGHRWTSDGPAVTLDPARFARVGEYHGFPVFARRGEPAEVVFLPAGAGTVAPYRRR